MNVDADVKAVKCRNTHVVARAVVVDAVAFVVVGVANRGRIGKQALARHIVVVERQRESVAGHISPPGIEVDVVVELIGHVDVDFMAVVKLSRKFVPMV